MSYDRVMFMIWCIYGLVVMYFGTMWYTHKLAKRISVCTHIAFDRELYEDILNRAAMKFISKSDDARIKCCRKISNKILRIAVDILWCVFDIPAAFMDALLWPVGLYRIMFTHEMYNDSLTELICEVE